MWRWGFLRVQSVILEYSHLVLGNFETLEVLLVCVLKAVIFFLGIPLSLSSWVRLLVLFSYLSVQEDISQQTYGLSIQRLTEKLWLHCSVPASNLHDKQSCANQPFDGELGWTELGYAQQDLYHCSLGLDKVLSWLSPGWTAWLSLLISWAWLGMFPGTEAGHCRMICLCS